MDFFLLFMSILWGCILSFPYILLAHTINSSKKQKEKALDRALARRNVVTAALKKRHNALIGEDTALNIHRHSTLGIYEYIYKGRTYKYRFYSDDPPSTLKLYFVRNPRRATVLQALSNDSLVRFIPLVLLLNIYFAYSVLLPAI